jgi:hypothetical protein
MESVTMNLVLNARDAMPDGGALTILTANTQLDEAWVRRHAPLLGYEPPGGSGQSGMDACATNFGSPAAKPKQTTNIRTPPNELPLCGQEFPHS